MSSDCVARKISSTGSRLSVGWPLKKLMGEVDTNGSVMVVQRRVDSVVGVMPIAIGKGID